MRVVVGSDHAGVRLKTAIKTFLNDTHHDILDLGTYSEALPRLCLTLQEAIAKVLLVVTSKPPRAANH